METSWRRPKFLRRPKRTLQRTGHIALNLFFALALVVLSYAPLVANVPGVGKSLAPQIARADNLDWSDMRGPLTDEADQSDVGGFTALPRFGEVPHPIAVAPNGHIFTAGNAGDMDFDSDGDCTSAGDIDLDGDAACDFAAPVVYKSEDGGLKWRAATIGTAALQGGALVRDIAVSPEYPNDDFIIVVFSYLDTAAGAAATTNGVAVSTDGGITFTISFSSAAADADLNEVVWRTVALSPDFDSSDRAGTIAIGGALRGANAAGEDSSVFRAQAGAFLDADDAEATWVGMTTATAIEAAGTITLSLRYAPDEEPIALGRVVTDGTETAGQVTTSSDWILAIADNADEIEPAGADFVATLGQFGFDDDYELNGIVYAAVSNAAGTVGGVFKFTGTWTDVSNNDADCGDNGDGSDLGFSSLSVTGNASNAVIIASAVGSVLVCRSTNAGSSWSDVDADGGDSVSDDAAMTGGTTMVGRNLAEPTRVYWTNSGALGGVSWSNNTGSGWQDSGLTNDAYTVRTVTEASAGVVFAGATDSTSLRTAIFKTTNYGTGSAWYRVDRTDTPGTGTGDPSTEVLLAPDFLTSGVAYIRRSGEGEERLLLSTNMGERFDATATDAIDDEALVTCSARSATMIICGTDEGNIFSTNDRGVSWTQVNFNETGNRIDEFDFSSNTDYFVTALDDDNTLKVWHTTDSGATWTLIGEPSPPWSTGDGGISTVLGNYSATTGAGTILVMTNGAVSTDEVYRINIGTDSTWTDIDMDITWTSFLGTGAPNQGDGRLFTLWQNTADGGPLLRQSYHLISGDVNNLDDADDDEDRIVNLPVPPVTTGTMGTSRSAAGYVLQTTAGNRIMEFQLNTEFLAPITLLDPPMNGVVITNTTDNGVPVIFRWEDVEEADEYDLIIGLSANLTDGVFVNAGAITTNVTEVDDAAGGKALIPGQTYYWAVRVASSDDVGGDVESNWSPTGKFSVVPASGSVSRSPELLLPTNNTTTANMGPILLSWNNPPGTAQYHIDVRPSGDDGPGIGLIISDAAMVASASYTIQPPMFGSGNYVMLPGATYNWRVRTSGATESIGVTDPSWGPWSGVFTFKTPRANAGTIQLVRPISGAVVTDRTPTLEWKDSNSQMFYYEVQLSADSDFAAGPRGPFTAVQHQLVHAGESNPPMSYTSPVTLTPGSYYWRIRQRTQATLLGPDEPGIAWSPTQSFMVQ